MADDPWFRDLLRIERPEIVALVFVRVAVAVGLPLVIFWLAGHGVAAVVGGAAALFVTLCDIGRTHADRILTMALAMLGILIGGFLGARYGATTLIDETLILVSAFVAGWVSNSHPGLASIARSAAIATTAGVGMQVSDPVAIVAVLFGGASAIGAACIMWLVHDVGPDENLMDWRSGLRRAIAGTDAGIRFAVCYAGACAVSLFAAEQLGAQSAYWVTFTVIIVMRREGIASLKLTTLYMLGTIAGVPVAVILAQISDDSPLVQIGLATVTAACTRLGAAINPALGYLAFTAFIVLIVELVQSGTVPPFELALTRLYDVGFGCLIALVATLAAGGTRRQRA